MRYMSSVATLLCSLIGVACDNGSGTSGSLAVEFSTGQRWVYDYLVEQTDTTGTTQTVHHDSLEVRVASLSDTVLGMSGLVRIEGRSLLPKTGIPVYPTDTMRVWYRVSDASLIEVAYQNAGMPFVMLRGKAVTRLEFGFAFLDPSGFAWSARSDGPPIRREDERIVLQYPLTVSSEWVSFTNPFREMRIVESIESVSLPVGTFIAACIKTTVDLGGNLVFYDWVSAEGLLKRSVEADVYIATVDDPGGGNQVAMRETTVLTSVQR